jgi:hypothetical protein
MFIISKTTVLKIVSQLVPAQFIIMLAFLFV